MKIVYISNSTIPSRTANSIHVMKMCQAFAQHGHEVVLLAPDRKDKNLEANVENIYEYYGVEKCFKVEKLPWLPVKGRGHIYGFLAALKSKFLSPYLVYGRSLTGCYFSSFFKSPVMFESHQPIYDSGRISELLFRRLIKHDTLKYLVVITGSLKKYYEANFTISKDQIIIAHDAADEPKYQNNGEVDLGNPDRLQVGYTGHLYPGKGMEIIAELAKRCSWADFHIIGGMEEDIAKWKMKLNNVNNVYFYGFVPHGKVDKYLRACDVLLAPYQKRVSACGGGDIAKWMSPLKIFEYMAAGKPIVCSNLSVLTEVLTDGKTALLCSPEDIASWEKALIRLHEDFSLQAYLSDNARNEFINNYTWTARAKKLIKQVN